MIDGTSVKKVNGYEYLGYARQTGQLLVYKGSQNYKSLDIKDPAPPHQEPAGTCDPLSQSNNESIKTTIISSPESSTHMMFLSMKIFRVLAYKFIYIVLFFTHYSVRNI